MLISALKGEQTVHLSCHPHCSLGTYLFVNQQTGEVVPITRFVDVGGMLQDIYEVAHKAERSRFQVWNKLKVWNSLQKHFHQEAAPAGLDLRSSCRRSRASPTRSMAARAWMVPIIAPSWSTPCTLWIPTTTM